MPSTELSAEDIPESGMTVIDILFATGLTASKGEARRLIQQGGIAVDDVKITDIAAVVSKEVLLGGVIIKKGKKIFHKVIAR